jgi:hypothetical protein
VKRSREELQETGEAKQRAIERSIGEGDPRKPFASLASIGDTQFYLPVSQRERRLADARGLSFRSVGEIDPDLRGEVGRENAIVGARIQVSGLYSGFRRTDYRNDDEWAWTDEAAPKRHDNSLGWQELVTKP